MPRIDQQRLDNRLERFDLGMRSPTRAKTVENDLAFKSKPMVDENGVVDWDAITIKGTSTKLEKDYLRLTQVRTAPFMFRLSLQYTRTPLNWFQGVLPPYADIDSTTRDHSPHVYKHCLHITLCRLRL